MNKPGSKQNPLKVAIIGSGPSGFYAAQALLEKDLKVTINMFERLPTPYGLVRSGVAPDHPKLKTAINPYKKIAEAEEFNFFGNVNVGQDISVEQIRATHHATIFASGAQTDRRLGIPGEDLLGNHTATEFVGWYNAHPDYRDFNFDLSQEVAVIIGQGNVASDVARILAKTVDELRHTDIAEHALDALVESKIKEIHIVGRRGPAQAKFSSKELKEFGMLSDCHPVIDMDVLEFSPQTKQEIMDKHNAGSGRNIEIFHNFATLPPSDKHRFCYFEFLKAPQEIIGLKQVEKIVFERNQLEGEAFSQCAVGTGEMTEIECGLVFRSIGYRGVAIPGVPFDDNRGIIPNKNGQVLDRDGSAISDMYVSGWIKRGPSGVIGTNILDSVETIDSLLNNLEQLGEREISIDDKLCPDDIKIVSFEDWKIIDDAEIKRGEQKGKPREKFTTVSEMLGII